MDLSKVLEIGEKIEIRYNTKYADSNENKSYYSMIQDVKNEDEIVITMPMSKGVQITLSLDQEIEIDFFREEGIFTFKARVIERFKNTNLNMIKVRKISPVIRLQRRRFFRLKITMPVYIMILDGNSDQDFDQDSDSWIKTYTLNLSGGGARILFNSKLEEETLLICRLKIKTEELKLKAKVVRCQLVEDDTLSRYELGIKFLDITEYQRDLIIKFIFEEQRELRKKGLI